MSAFNPALGRQKQRNLCGFEANLVYVASFRTARAAYIVRSCLEKQTNKHKANSNKTKNFFLIIFNVCVCVCERVCV